MEVPDYLDLIGSPFQLKGRCPSDGIDCSGLVFEMFERLGEHDNVLLYPEGYYRRWIEVQYENIEPMDVVFLHSDRHVGIYVGDGKLLHSKPKLGVVLSNLAAHSKQITRIQRLIKCLP